MLNYFILSCVYSAISQLNKLVMEKVGYHLVRHHVRSSNMLTIFPYSSVFCSDECLFTPVKNAIFLPLDKIKQPCYYFYQYI